MRSPVQDIHINFVQKIRAKSQRCDQVPLKTAPLKKLSTLFKDIEHSLSELETSSSLLNSLTKSQP